VLVVDDSPTVRAVLRAYLRALGVRCVCTEDGAHALTLLRAAAARRKPYHAVLVDWEMPILDGVAVAQAISKEPEIAAIPIVLLTDLGQRRIARRAARQSGVAAYLSKPVRTDRLETCLLAVLDEHHGDHAHQSAAPEHAAPRRLPNGTRILVAEDDPASQRVVVRLLEKRGHQVDAVGDGRSAVEACLRRVYDLVLMDGRLPDLDGFAATIEIRRREPALRRTPIVALTASAGAELGRRCVEAGMDGYLAKPIRTDQLDALLDRLLSPARRSTPPPSLAPSVLDAEGLLDRVDGDLEFVSGLVAGLQRDVPRWLAELRAASERGDAHALEEVAHAVRGSASNLGGASAASVAAHLEADARRGEVTDSARLVADLTHELDALQAALLALCTPAAPHSRPASGIS